MSISIHPPVLSFYIETMDEDDIFDQTIGVIIVSKYKTQKSPFKILLLYLDKNSP